jgi:hypothetical protein
VVATVLHALDQNVGLDAEHDGHAAQGGQKEKELEVALAGKHGVLDRTGAQGHGDHRGDNAGGLAEALLLAVARVAPRDGPLVPLSIVKSERLPPRIQSFKETILKGWEVVSTDNVVIRNGPLKNLFKVLRSGL